ncbi:MAG TPA: hypothetical protein VD864_11885 [Nocardioides sp.]|nr:hypothetical protein [Nocardioides sp.]
MHRRWLTRALIALAVPALTVPTLATPATAAGAQVPGIDAVAEIYPHLEGGTASESAGKVYGPGKKCGTTKVIKGASQRSASYSPDYSSGDPDAYVVNGERPMVSATAMQFPTTKAAIAYLHGSAKSTRDCPGGGGPGGGGGGGGTPDCKSSMKKIKFSLGDERWGYQIKSTCKTGDQTTSMVFNSLFARKGKFIVYTSAMSMDATAPSIPKSIDMTDLALKTVS